MRSATVERPAEQIETEHARQPHHRRRAVNVEQAIRIPEYVPAPLYVGLTLGSIAASLALFTRKRKDDAIFVGLWAPTFLALGIFAKLVGIRRSRGTEAGV